MASLQFMRLVVICLAMLSPRGTAHTNVETPRASSFDLSAWAKGSISLMRKDMKHSFVIDEAMDVVRVDCANSERAETDSAILALNGPSQGLASRSGACNRGVAMVDDQ